MATPKGQIVFHGVHVDDQGNAVEPAAYAVDVPALNDGETFPGSFQIVSDLNFRLQEMTHAFEGIAAGAHVNLKVQMQVTNGRPWHIGKPIFINAISSQDAGLPRRPIMQRLILKQAVVSVDFTEAT